MPTIAPPRLESFRSKTTWFALFIIGCSTLFLGPLRELFHLSLSSDTYSHILATPLISIWLIYLERETIFREATRTGKSAAYFLGIAAILRIFTWQFGKSISGEGSLALAIVGFLFLVWSGFSWVCGDCAFRAGVFPLLFLLLMIPLPVSAVDRIILWLQWGSGDVTSWIFHATRTPVIRHGLSFTLPSVTIEIAKECSGIRSAIALVISCLAAGYLLLRSPWTRVILTLATVPVLVLKNGLRIATLTLLAIHVDPGFLDGHLHQQGGFVFFAAGLTMLLPVLWCLQKLERKRSGSRPPDQRNTKFTGEDLPQRIAT